MVADIGASFSPGYYLISGLLSCGLVLSIFTLVGKTDRLERIYPAIWVFITTLFLLVAWAFKVFLLIENCGAGGPCEGFGFDWEFGRAARAAAFPPVVFGLATLVFLTLSKRGRGIR